MKRKIVSVFIIAICVILPYGCETVTHFERNTDFTLPEGTQIAVLPFSGNPAFRRVSAEWFSFQMRKQKHFQILEPASVEITLKQKGLQIPTDEKVIVVAQEAGKLLNAAAVIAGNLTVKYGMEVHAIVKVTLIDARSGEVVATSIQSDQLLGSFSEHPHVVAATERAASDILTVLNDAAKSMAPAERRDN